MTEPTAAWQEQVAALGPFFAVETHPAASEIASPWHRLSEVAREDSGVLRERVTAVRASLAARSGRPAEAVEQRVAASVAHLGLVARVISPLLGLAALRGLPSPPPTLDDLRWHSGLGGAFALSLPRETVAASVATGNADNNADAVEKLLDGPIRELGDAAASFSVSPRILWGNVASAVNGAAAGMVSAAPALTRPARAAALLFLSRPQLQGTHTLDAGNGRFRRGSCCLIYRAAPGASGAICGDCVLARP